MTPPPPWPAEGPGLRGRLELPAVLRSSVVVLRLLADPGPEGDISIRAIADLGKRAVTNDGLGFAFWIPDLPPGRYRLATAAGPQGTLRDGGWVDVPDGVGETRIVIPGPPRSELLVVRASGQDGKPLRAFQVYARYVEEGRTLAESANTSPPEEGAVTVLFRRPPGGGPGLPPFDPERGRFVALVSTKEGTVRGECAVTVESALEVTVGEPGSLSVIPRGLPKGPLRERIVGGLAWPGSREIACSAPGEALRSGAMVEFPKVQPGAYDFVIRTGFHECAWDLVRVPVTVGGRNQALRVAVPPLHAITVRGAPSGIVLRRLEPPKWEVRLFNTSTDGTLRVADLPPGRYAAAFSERAVEFSLPGAGEIDLSR